MSSASSFIFCLLFIPFYYSFISFLYFFYRVRLFADKFVARDHEIWLVSRTVPREPIAKDYPCPVRRDTAMLPLTADVSTPKKVVLPDSFI